MHKNIMFDLSLLFVGGVFIFISENKKLKDFFIEDLKISDDYINNKLSTILLNGHPIDSLDIYLEPDSRLALSAAMPGVAGAALRFNGFYKNLRSGISYKENLATNSKNFFVDLHLYNQVGQDLAENILKYGFFAEQSKLNQALLAYKKLIEIKYKENYLFLQSE